MRRCKGTRQICFDGFTLDDFEREAISFLREHEPPEGYFVGFSGGKDSIVTLQLVRMSGVKHTPYYTCTRIDPPEMYRFIKPLNWEQWCYCAVLAALVLPADLIRGILCRK